MSSQNTLLISALFELNNVLKEKINGCRYIPASVAGENLAAGRAHVTIDEAIAHWQSVVNELKDSDNEPNTVTRGGQWNCQSVYTSN